MVQNVKQPRTTQDKQDRHFPALSRAGWSDRPNCNCDASVQRTENRIPEPKEPCSLLLFLLTYFLIISDQRQFLPFWELVHYIFGLADSSSQFKLTVSTHGLLGYRLNELTTVTKSFLPHCSNGAQDAVPHDGRHVVHELQWGCPGIHACGDDILGRVVGVCVQLKWNFREIKNLLRRGSNEKVTVSKNSTKTSKSCYYNAEDRLENVLIGD